MRGAVPGGVPGGSGGGSGGGIPGGVPGAVGGGKAGYGHGGHGGHGGRQGGGVPGIAGLPADVPGVVHGSMEDLQDWASKALEVSMGYLQMDGLEWNIPLKWMIWGYPYFRKPPDLFW